MQKDLISFIIPNRGGIHLMSVIDNINEMYSMFKKEIIVIEQCDAEPFKKGQLFNIAIKRCNGEYVAMQDNDIIHFRTIRLFDVLKENNMKPYLGFTHTSQIPGPKKPYIITDTRLRPSGYGAFLFGLTESFIKANGFSNLYIGWGSEDVEIGIRIADELLPNGLGKVFRVPQSLGHITHLSRCNRSDRNVQLNDWLFNTRHNRDYRLDGIEDTTYNLISDEVVNGVRWIRVDNIGVRQPFAYNDLLELREEAGRPPYI